MRPRQEILGCKGVEYRHKHSVRHCCKEVPPVILTNTRRASMEDGAQKQFPITDQRFLVCRNLVNTQKSDGSPSYLGVTLGGFARRSK